MLDVRYVVQSFQLVIKYVAPRLLGGQVVSSFFDILSSIPSTTDSSSRIYLTKAYLKVQLLQLYSVRLNPKQKVTVGHRSTYSPLFLVL